LDNSILTVAKSHLKFDEVLIGYKVALLAQILQCWSNIVSIMALRNQHHCGLFVLTHPHSELHGFLSYTCNHISTVHRTHKCNINQKCVAKLLICEALPHLFLRSCLRSSAGLVTFNAMLPTIEGANSISNVMLLS
jgi:hypothetical protein